MKDPQESLAYFKPGTFKKLLLIMKLSVLLMFFTCLQLSAIVNSQTVSLTASDASLKSVLKEFRRQSEH